MEGHSLEIDKKENIDVFLNSSEIVVNPDSGLAMVVIKPDAFKKRESIVKRLENSGLYIVSSISRRLPENFVLGAMYNNLPKSIAEQTLKHFNEGESEILLVKGGNNLIDNLVSLTGDKTNPSECKEESIRYLFGEHFGRDTDDGKTYFRNAIHRARNEKEQKDDLEKFRHII